ncbi:hypothetical protein [Pontibacter mangrovi]|uniref:hypothetical protein n=1 Tax=Pontibacter mangrovi TaxID=2589816 RepID=UPI0015E40C24|nr:hypothetical protein [Pontibacter mangrovi]
MKAPVQYKTAEGVLIASTKTPTYATRTRAAKKAKEKGHSTLYEQHGEQRRYNLSAYIK